MEKISIEKIIQRILLMVIILLSIISIKSLARYTASRYYSDQGTKNIQGGIYSGFYKNGSKGLGDLKNASHGKIGGTYVPFFWMGTSGRSVSYPSYSDLVNNMTGFRINIVNNMVYCSDNVCTTREGKFDKKIWWLPDENDYPSYGVTTDTFDNLLEAAKRTARNYARTYDFASYTNHPDDDFYHTATRYNYYRITNASLESTTHFASGVKIYSAWLGYGEVCTRYRHGWDEGVRRDLMLLGTAKATSISVDAIGEMFNIIGGTSAKAWGLGDASLDGEGVNELAKSDINDGPKITVVESGNIGKGDVKAAGYTFKDETGAMPMACKYALTAIGKLYAGGANDYDPCDIQVAWWILVDSGSAVYKIGDGSMGGSYSGSKGWTLANEAIQYGEFYSKYAKSMKSNVWVDTFKDGDNKTQAIIDHKNQTYTVGPFAIHYPNYREFVYVKQIVAETTGEEGKTQLYYNHAKADFDLIFVDESGAYVSGNNGISGDRKFPLSDKKFYIQFPVEKVGHITDVKLTGYVEYLANASISAHVARGRNGNNQAVTYKYVAHYKVTEGYFNNSDPANDNDWDSHNCYGTCPIIKIDYQTARPHYVEEVPYVAGHPEYWYWEAIVGGTWTHGFVYRNDPNWQAQYNAIPPGATIIHYDYVAHQEYEPAYYYYTWNTVQSNLYIVRQVWFQPFIKMSNKPVKIKPAQGFTRAGSNGVRDYKVVNSSKSIHFTMNLEGMVFEDVRTGKDNAVNGKYSTNTSVQDPIDKPIANVIVLLYKHKLGNVGQLGDNRDRGELIDAKWTDNSGKFKFTNLNEMYKYHVEYIYNGQYYEPTKCTTKVTYTTGTEADWNNASKAIDDNIERDNFNKKFEEVGSSNRNVIPSSVNANGRVYTYKSGTLKELIDAGFIDQYGNIMKTHYQSTGGETNGPKFIKGQESRANEAGIKDVQYKNKTNFLKNYGGYADASMIRAYTASEAKDNNGQIYKKFDLYPFEHVFVADETVHATHLKIENKRIGNRAVLSGKIKPLYGQTNADKDLMRKVNLGLVRREEIDFALQKDVFSVIFELNGKEYIYRYNTRRGVLPAGVDEWLEGYELEDRDSMLAALQHANKTGFAVVTRVKYNYSYYKEEDYRFVYREDYEYNANMYRQLKVQDSNGAQHNLSDAEYNDFIAAKRKGELEIYVKYRITLRNFSSGLNGRITEIVDHSDTEFTLIGNTKTADGDKVVQGKVLQREVDKYRPYIGYGLNGEKLSNEMINGWSSLDLTADKASEQFGAMISGSPGNYRLNANAQYLTTSSESIYKNEPGGTSVKLVNFEADNQYKTTYITGMENVYLTNKYFFVDLYVTYRVNKWKNAADGTEYLILDETVNGLPISLPNYNPKSNLAEIRGYKTYYSKSAKAPNRDNKDNNIFEEFKEGENKLTKDDVAGILDSNSTPGNLKYAKRQYDKELNGEITDEIRNVAAENDADRAPLLRLILNWDETREVTGSTFEDERTEKYGSSNFGDGKFDTASDKAINGTRVQLVELAEKDGQPIEIIWKEVKVGDKEDLDPVINQFGLIGQYNLLRTFTRDNLGNESSIPTGADDSDADHTNDTTGNYRILGFPTGDFIVRFIYGSDADTAVGHKGYDYNTVDYIENEIEGLATYDVTSSLRNPVTTGANIYTNAKYYYRALELGLGEKDNRSTNEKSYTGNDYKSTTYRTGYYEDVNHRHSKSATNTIDYNPAKTGEYEFDFKVNDEGGRLSDAKDIYARRQEVISYSNNSNKNQINHNAEVLASFEEQQNASDQDIKKYLNELYENTYMYADSGVIHVNTEYNSTEREVKKNEHSVGDANYDKTGFYTIANLDFGLEERPKAQLKTTVEVANVKITLANGNVEFDAIKTATNLQWQKHLAHGPDSYNTYDKGNNYTDSDNDYNFMNIPSVRNPENKGLILPTMDQELLQGAKIEITYLVSVANIGEVDFYQDDKVIGGASVPYCSWYNKHRTDGVKIVKTKAKELICYVGTQLVPDAAGAGNIVVSRNNILFSEADNKNEDGEAIWEVIDKSEVYKIAPATAAGFYVNDLVNARNEAAIKEYKVMIHTTNDSKFYEKDLVPIIRDQTQAKKIRKEVVEDPLNSPNTINASDSVVAEKLTLSSVLTGDFSTTDMTYNNIVELVRVDNTVGRRMAFSIVGNQSPIHNPTEIDADISEEVSIIPPFGQSHFNYYLGFGLAGIIILGGLLVMAFTRKKE